MEGVGKQSLEEFWGAELSSKKKVFSWADDGDEEAEDMFIDKTLELRQACLGVSAKEGERNVVQVMAENDEGEEVRHTILSLRVGGTEQCSLFLSLNPPVSFELVSGSGPVHIVGSMLETMSSMDDFSGDSSSSDEEDISNSEVTSLVNSAKKRPASSPVAKPAKQIKLDASTSSDNNSSAKIAPVKRSKKKPVVQEELDDEDDDDDDDDADDEDMSDGDESMSDEDDEEEEEEIKPPTKKPQNNGKAKQKELTKKLFKFDTPQPAKQAIKATKGTKSAPTTPKQSEKKVGGMKVGVSLDEAKKRLLKQLPNVPKKLEKFNNFVGNSFKIKDDSTKKELWEFVQKSR